MQRLSDNLRLENGYFDGRFRESTNDNYKQDMKEIRKIFYSFHDKKEKYLPCQRKSLMTHYQNMFNHLERLRKIDFDEYLNALDTLCEIKYIFEAMESPTHLKHDKGEDLTIRMLDENLNPSSKEMYRAVGLFKDSLTHNTVITPLMDQLLRKIIGRARKDVSVFTKVFFFFISLKKKRLKLFALLGSKY